jgi:hypothetical protein
LPLRTDDTFDFKKGVCIYIYIIFESFYKKYNISESLKKKYIIFERVLKKN